MLRTATITVTCPSETHADVEPERCFQRFQRYKPLPQCRPNTETSRPPTRMFMVWTLARDFIWASDRLSGAVQSLILTGELTARD